MSKRYNRVSLNFWPGAESKPSCCPVCNHASGFHSYRFTEHITARSMTHLTCDHVAPDDTDHTKACECDFIVAEHLDDV